MAPDVKRWVQVRFLSWFSEEDWPFLFEVVLSDQYKIVRRLVFLALLYFTILFSVNVGVFCGLELGIVVFLLLFRLLVCISSILLRCLRVTTGILTLVLLGGPLGFGIVPSVVLSVAVGLVGFMV